MKYDINTEVVREVRPSDDNRTDRMVIHFHKHASAQVKTDKPMTSRDVAAILDKLLDTVDGAIGFKYVNINTDDNTTDGA